MIFILELFHALTYAAAQALTPDKSKQKLRMDWIKAQSNAAGWVARVIAALKPHRDRSEAVAVCIRTYEANADRMRYDLYRKLRLLIGFGVVESACKQIVGSRFNWAGCHWPKACTNALLAVKCCLKNNRWTDFFDWRACSAAAA